MKPGEVVTLWRVQGIPFTYWATKIEAERAARLRFPDEDFDKRYARVFYLQSEPHSLAG